MALLGKIVELATIELHPFAHRIRESAIKTKGSEAAHERSFPMHDWQRLTFVFGRLRPGETCLEVGPGRCFLTKMMVDGELYGQLSAIDILETRPVPRAVDYRVMDVASMDYPDDSFDTVLCMEVIEHLDDDDARSALLELRRVCRGQLIIMVPYCETEPLPAHHKQRFDERRIQDSFPDANYTLMLKKPVSRVPWLLIEEDRTRA
jgi:methyltransferase family protein